MRANTLTTTTRHTHKETRDTVLNTVNYVKDKHALAIMQEIKEEALCGNRDGLLLF